jgi:hypothetical protein
MITQEMLRGMFSQMDWESIGLPNFPDFPDDMHPWDIVASMKDQLPPYEQKIIELIEKINEVQALLDELQCGIG